VKPQYTETYTFFTRTDDGVRLWVNNQLLIDHWNDQGTTEYSGVMPLTAGNQYPIRMEFFEDGGAAESHLLWQSASQPKQVIPPTALSTNNPITSVEPAEPISRVTLLPTAPNPARGSTHFRFAVPNTGPATLRLFSVTGRFSATVFQGVADGQRMYDIPFDARSMAAGVYFERLEAAGIELTKKVVILRH